jgi:hypothetical protein
MPLPDPDTVCAVLKGVVSDEAACRTRLTDLETMKETIADCSSDAVAAAKKLKPVVAILVTQPGCPHCADQVAAAVGVMGKNKEFAAVEASIEEDGCSKLAEEEGATSTPTTVFYHNGERVIAFSGAMDPPDLEQVVADIAAGKDVTPPGEDGKDCTTFEDPADIVACVERTEGSE